MPFTFSHPAIVLPLTRAKLGLSATGLIIGSIVPDFEYFMRFRNQSRYSHTLTGLFWFDLPLALLTCFLYHLVVRKSLIDNLPVFLKSRLIQFRNFQWSRYFRKNWIPVLLSILIGAFSHLLWDAFTHETRFVVQRQTELSEFMKIGKVNLAGYKFLQLFSTIAGGLAIIISIMSLKKSPLERKPVDYRYWALIFFISAPIICLRFINGMEFDEIRLMIVTVISSLMIALIIAPIILHQDTPRPVELLPQKRA